MARFWSARLPVACSRAACTLPLRLIVLTDGTRTFQIVWTASLISVLFAPLVDQERVGVRLEAGVGLLGDDRADDRRRGGLHRRPLLVGLVLGLALGRRWRFERRPSSRVRRAAVGHHARRSAAAATLVGRRGRPRVTTIACTSCAGCRNDFSHGAGAARLALRREHDQHLARRARARRAARRRPWSSARRTSGPRPRRACRSARASVSAERRRRGRIFLLTRMVVVAGHGAVGDAAAGPLRRADGALARAAGALLAPRLPPAAARPRRASSTECVPARSAASPATTTWCISGTLTVASNRSVGQLARARLLARPRRARRPSPSVTPPSSPAA